MYKLAFIFLFLAYVHAKTVKKGGVYYKNDPGYDPDLNEPLPVCLADTSKDTLWVLDFNDDLDFKVLRSANKMDFRAFRELMEPLIKDFIHQQILNASDEKKSKTNSTNTTEQIKATDTEEMTKYDLKKAIKLMINKFVLSFKDDVSLYLSPDDYDKVSIKLYFKGPYTSMIVRYKSRRWQFFLRPPSSLPRWFYQKHTNITRTGKAMFVDIPDSVRNEFYGKFFYMVKAFISFAI